MSGPIFFAWVDGTETTFDPLTHAREDEDVFSFTITHEEGQIPVLDLVLRYPEVAGVAIGLLRAGRKQWAWLSWRNGSGDVEPLFFGRMVGFPDNVNDILVPIRFLARARNYVGQKQALADTLRVRPYYDPIFLDDKALEDPDAILEGLSADFHIDRLSLEWSVSDILLGDETIYFDESDVIDGSVEINVRQAPLRAVRVDATVHWKQNYRNTLIPVVVAVGVKTLTGKDLASQWPKVGASLNGGWVVANGSYAIARGYGENGTHEEAGSWTSQEKNHNDGDAISVSWSASIPIDHGIIVNEKVNQTFGSMGGSTNFLNTPPDANGKIQIGTGEQSGGQSSSSLSANSQVIFTGTVDCALFIQPDGQPNNFTETLSLTLTSDLQPLLTDPTSQEETEVIELQGQDIGEAFVDFKCLTTLSGQAVAAGQIMLPNLTPGPGGTSYQIALNAGTAPVVETEEDAPLFSDVIGEVTAWGPIDFACVGASLPTIIDWAPQTFVKVGTLLCFAPLGGWFFFCDQEGFTGDNPPFYAWLTGLPAPGLSTPGTRFGDGSAAWVALGSGGPSLHVPAQGQPDNIVANSFFDQERGAATVEYMISIARNKMRTRARAIEVRFRTTFAKGVELSCRKSASVHAPKIIPGGWATGKVIAYTLAWSGLTGQLSADVTIGCAIGSGAGDAASVIGTPTVAELDALEASAQVMDGASLLIGSDVSYEPLPPDLTYNGLRFPLTRDQIVMASGWMGNYQNQCALARRAMTQQIDLFGKDIGGAIKNAQVKSSAKDAAVELMKTEAGSIYYEFWLRPISDQHVDTPYVAKVSKLTIPKQINLEA